jgi:hypothetical protein
MVASWCTLSMLPEDHGFQPVANSNEELQPEDSKRSLGGQGTSKKVSSQ